MTESTCENEGSAVKKRPAIANESLYKKVTGPPTECEFILFSLAASEWYAFTDLNIKFYWLSTSSASRSAGREHAEVRNISDYDAAGASRVRGGADDEVVIARAGYIVQN